MQHSFQLASLNNQGDNEQLLQESCVLNAMLRMLCYLRFKLLKVTILFVIISNDYII